MSAGSNDTSSPAPISSRAALRNAGMGEIVQVQGGHIVRSTGRKDRHSKVCTAKGPRDRRVRLSAHTAIQFYDVQDRLGYDRPSKAVDWLIKKAKTAIDQLEELPAWKPTTATMVNVRQQRRGKNVAAANEDDEGAGAAAATNMEVATGESSRSSLALTDGQRRRGVGEMYDNAADGSGGGLLPPSMDSDSIADTIKSFFPVGGSGASATQVTAGEVTDAMRSVVSSSGGVHSMQFQTYPPPQHDLLSRRHFNNGQTTQDLKLSLQSFQDPVGFQTHHHHRHQNPHQHDHNQEDTQQQQQQQQSLFEFSNPSTGWGSDSQQQQAAELGRYQRQLIGWNFGNVDSDCTRGSGGGGGFVFVPPQQAQQQPLLQQLFGHGIGVGGGSVVHHGIGPNNSSVHNAAATATSQLYSQRGPLQSSNTPSIRAWMGENFIDKDGNQHKDDHRQAAAGAFIHPVSLSGIGFTSSGGFSGFHIPARIQGGDEEQQHDGNNPNMSSSASPGSHH